MGEKQGEVLPLGHLGLWSEMSILFYCLGLTPRDCLLQLLFYNQLLPTQAAPVALRGRAAKTASCHSFLFQRPALLPIPQNPPPPAASHSVKQL